MHKLFITFILVLGLPGYLFAADLSDLTYVIEGDEVTITDCDTAASGELVIPDLIEGKPVTAIGDFAFVLCQGITSISIPDSVNSIGIGAFNGCRGMEDIRLPEAISTIENDTFYNCESLTNVTIPHGVTNIGDYAFLNCKSMASVSIHSGVSSIGEWAFGSCNGLSEIIVDAENEYYSSLDGVLFDKAQTLLKRYPPAKSATTYSVPQSVSDIGIGAFGESENLVSIILGEYIVNIEHYAFILCVNLGSINLPNGITTIEASVFEYCENLSSITIPSGVTSIGNNSFGGCDALTKITLPASIEFIELAAFADCENLTKVTFEGDAPEPYRSSIFRGHGEGFAVYFYEGSSGFSAPIWQGYPSVMLPAPDEDGDNWPDYLEEILGTDPDRADSQFRSWMTSNAGILKIHYGPYSDACTFVVECTEDLNDPDSWEPVAGLGFTGDLTEQVADLGAASGAPKFYRVRVSYTAE